jgi:YD repeat-containing protein
MRSGRKIARVQLRPPALASAATPNGVTSYAYDAADRLTGVSYPNGASLSYAYNANGQRASMTDQAGNTVKYTYDQAGRLSQLTNAANALIVGYTYDATGHVSRKTYGNQAYTTYAYDAAGDLLHLVNYGPSGAITSRYDYTYDAKGQKTSMSTLDGVWTYQYDPKGQVVAENLPNGSAILFTYDAAGNRIGANYYGRSTEYNVNNLNQYTSATGSSYTYDADGNMTSKSDNTGTTTYTYDDDGRMLSATNASGTTNYDYDAFGNLAGQASATATTQYVSDLASVASAAAGLSGMAQLAGTMDTAGNMTQLVQGLDAAASIAAGGVADYYQTDSAPGEQQGNVDQVMGSTGALDTYTYNLNGVQSSSVNAPQPLDYQSSIDMGNNTNYTPTGVYDQSTGRNMQPNGPDPNNSGYSAHFPNPLEDLESPYDQDSISNGIEATSLMPLGNVVDGMEGAHTEWFRSAENEFDFVPVKIAKETYGSHLLKGVGNVLTVVGVAADGCNLGTAIRKGDPYDIVHNAGFVALDFLVAAQPELAPVQQAIVVLDFTTQKFANWLYGVNNAVPPGWKAYRQQSFKQSNIKAGGDPNGKMTVGFGDQGYIPPNTPIAYTIYFENEPTATAPAEKVVVTDPLDANLDLSTVQLTQIAFNNVTLNLPAGLQSYSAQTAVSTDPNPVTVNASLDPGSGIITWTIQSVDPATGSLPADPSAGFLPPDNSSHSGDGSLSFSVLPKAGLANGAVISNTASVVFDANAAIKTNTVTNTIDSTYPTSAVNALPAVTATPTFTVSWSGSDPSGAGIQSYDIWAAVDGGPYALWLAATTLTSSAYTGAVGHTYSFYSLATSNTGRRQPTPAAAATTQVIALQASQTALTASPSTADFGAAITFTATVTGSGSQIPTGSVSFLDGANSIGTATLNTAGAATLSIATLAAGQHSVTAQYGGDNNFSASASTALSVTVSAPDFTLASASGAMTVDRGSSATMALTVTPQNVYNQSIAFSCSNLPPGMTCSFAPASVTPQASAATTTMTVTASSTTATLQRRSLPWGGGTVFAAALFCALGRKRRYAITLMLSIAIVALGLLATGCGGGGQAPVTSTISVTATSGNVQHSVNIAVTVD